MQAWFLVNFLFTSWTVFHNRECGSFHCLSLIWGLGMPHLSLNFLILLSWMLEKVLINLHNAWEHFWEHHFLSNYFFLSSFQCSLNACVFLLCGTWLIYFSILHRASAIFVGVYEPTKQKLLKSFPEYLSALAHLVIILTNPMRTDNLHLARLLWQKFLHWSDTITV
jgi:hypothetical protein